MKSKMPILGRYRGTRNGLAAVEFEASAGEVHRQLVPADWVVGAPQSRVRSRWQGPARPYALVMVPTRELAEQVQKELVNFSEYDDLASVALFGNQDMRQKLRTLAHGADIMVASPGALINALHRGLVSLDRIRYLVFDEVDRMMELDFGAQLEEIMEHGGMPSTADGRQTSFWSATLPVEVKELTEGFLGSQCIWVDCTGGQNNPLADTIQHVMIDGRPTFRTLRQFEKGMRVVTSGGRVATLDQKVGRRSWRLRYEGSDHDGIQRFKKVRVGKIFSRNFSGDAVEEEKVEHLLNILKMSEFENSTAIIFCRKRETCAELYKFLKDEFSRIVCAHGGMPQGMRAQSVQALRDKKADLLVATDIAARGLDIPGITHIINFELPLVLDEFVHRCGRTGRIGRKGTAITFVTGREIIFKPLKRLLGSQGHRLPEWCTYEGLDRAWRPDGLGRPAEFQKERQAFDPKTATLKQLQERLRKRLDTDLSTSSSLMEKARYNMELSPEAVEKEAQALLSEATAPVIDYGTKVDVMVNGETTDRGRTQDDYFEDKRERFAEKPESPQKNWRKKRRERNERNERNEGRDGEYDASDRGENRYYPHAERRKEKEGRSQMA